MAKEKIFLIDGYAFLFRAFFASPKLTAPNGTPIGAIHGFIQMLFKLIEKHSVKRIAVILDKSTAKKTHRHNLYPEYKMHRPEVPEELKIQRELVDYITQNYIKIGKIKD